MGAIRLTDTFLRGLKVAAGERREVADAVCAGLTLRASATKKAWAFVAWDKSAQRATRVTIGPFPEVTLAEARRRADELRAALAKGERPAEERRVERQQAKLTFDAGGRNDPRGDGAGRLAGRLCKPVR